MRSVLIGDVYSTSSEVSSEIERKKSPGIPSIYEGCPTKGQWLDAHPNPIMSSKEIFDTQVTPVLWNSVMKKEPVTLAKYLSRKQRMFMVMPVHAIVLHKHYFSKQSKRCRGFREIAHGQTFFFGGVNRLAEELIGSQVDSEDDFFWDKRFLIMESVYKLRKRGIEYESMDPSDRRYVDMLVECLERPIVVLPNGDVIRINNRTNPSGADATTENNCIARLLFENYVLVKYCDVNNISPHHYIQPRVGTHYLGDDRIAASRGFPPGYLDFYRTTIPETGVLVKSLVRTDGPVGSEFAGFTIQRAHWNKDEYVPYYRLDKLWFGLFATTDLSEDITLSRMCAFAFLLYPQYTVFKAVKPIVINFVQRMKDDSLRQVVLTFWSDEQYLQRMWTGKESAHEARVEREARQRIEMVLEAEGYFPDVDRDFNDASPTQGPRHNC